jgi:DNA-directed RNA polymerase
LYKADELYAFISGILEYKSYLRDNNYKTCLIIALDATTNVYQLTALLANDGLLAKEVNLVHKNEPKDLYSKVSEGLEKEFKQTIPRALIKKSVMCYAYGLTQHGILNYIKEEYEKLNTKDFYNLIDKSSLLKLSKKLRIFLSKHYPGIILVRELLEHAVKEMITSNIDKPIIEKCLNIETVFIKYTHFIQKSKKDVVSHIKNIYNISIDSNKQERIRVYIVSYLNELYISKMTTSITANFIHSIDAECLMYVLATLHHKKITCFTIHDCFMVSPKYLSEVINTFKYILYNLKLKDKLKNLYQKNNLDPSIVEGKLSKIKENFNYEKIKEANHILV